MGWNMGTYDPDDERLRDEDMESSDDHEYCAECGLQLEEGNHLVIENGSKLCMACIADMIGGYLDPSYRVYYEASDDTSEGLKLYFVIEREEI